MRAMTITRSLVGAIGVGLVVVGLMKALDHRAAAIRETAVWLLAGVVLHDAVLAPLVVLLGVVVVRLLPVWARMPVVAGFVVLGTATLTAIPVLGRFGERPDNPTLLDRDYVAGWWFLTALVVIGVVAVSLWQRHRLDAMPERRTVDVRQDGRGTREGDR